jgi:hypothetical protein
MFKVLMLLTACVVHVTAMPTAAMPTAPRARVDLPVCNVDRDPECVHMDSIKELYFHASCMTAHRRGPVARQVNCSDCWRWTGLIGVRCVRGSPESQLQWFCTSMQDNDHRVPRPIYNAVISCEGCNSADDPFVLKGSCSLTYERRAKASDVLFLIFFMAVVILLACSFEWRGHRQSRQVSTVPWLFCMSSGDRYHRVSEQFFASGVQTR